MPARRFAAVAAAMTLLASTACRVSETAAPVESMAARLPRETARVYVLERGATALGAPHTLLDLTCDSTRTVVSVHDTVRLWRDGRALRSARTVLTRNGAIGGDGMLEHEGRWHLLPPSPDSAHDDGVRVALTLHSQKSGDYTWTLQWGQGADDLASSPAGFTTRMARGGTCTPGARTVVADPPRFERWQYLPERD